MKYLILVILIVIAGVFTPPKVMSYEPSSSLDDTVIWGDLIMPIDTSKLLTADDWISYLKPIAQYTYPKNTVMQQVVLTQAILEAGLQDGKPSKLALPPNYNLFGIKAKSQDDKVEMSTREVINGRNKSVNASFAKYRDYEHAFNGHINLMHLARYINVLRAKDVKGAFLALVKGGYATDPKYVNLLTNTWEQFVKPHYTKG